MSAALSLMFVMLTGKKFTLDDVYPDTKVRDLKQRIQNREGIPPDMQRPIYMGKEITDNQTVAECGISENTSLHLILRLRGD